MVLSGRRFVEDQGGRLEGERDGQREPLLLAEGQRQWGSIQDPLEVVEGRPAQAVRDERLERGRVSMEVHRAEDELVANGPGEQHLAWALEDVPERGCEV